MNWTLLQEKVEHAYVNSRNSHHCPRVRYCCLHLTIGETTAGSQGGAAGQREVTSPLQSTVRSASKGPDPFGSSQEITEDERADRH